MGVQAENGGQARVVSVVGDGSVGNLGAKLATLVPSTPYSAFFSSSRWLKTKGCYRVANPPHVTEVQLSRPGVIPQDSTGRGTRLALSPDPKRQRTA